MPIAYSRLELGAPTLEGARAPGFLEDSSGTVLGADAAGLGARAPRPVRVPGTVDCGEEQCQRVQGRRESGLRPGERGRQGSGRGRQEFKQETAQRFCGGSSVF